MKIFPKKKERNPKMAKKKIIKQWNKQEEEEKNCDKEEKETN